VRLGAAIRNTRAVFVAALLLSACGQRAADVRARISTPPMMELAGQRVLVLPVQSNIDLGTGGGERATAELVFAVTERNPRVTWVAPAELRSALRRLPAYAAAPDSLPVDPLLSHGERRAVDPLAGILRRYAALMDTRYVLLPREVHFTPGADSTGELRISAVLLDARTGDVIWWGDGTGAAASAADRAGLTLAAAALARRLVNGSGEK
jgi:hypothetical protein